MFSLSLYKYQCKALKKCFVSTKVHINTLWECFRKQDTCIIKGKLQHYFFIAPTISSGTCVYVFQTVLKVLKNVLVTRPTGGSYSDQHKILAWSKSCVSSMTYIFGQCDPHASKIVINQLFVHFLVHVKCPGWVSLWHKNNISS